METKITRRKAIRTLGAAGAAAMLLDPTSALAQASAQAAGREQIAALTGGVKDGRYVLPDLPYAYDALEPALEARTLRLHHQKHHAQDLAALNATLDKLAEARKEGKPAAVKTLLQAQAHYGGNHELHCLLWRSMSPRQIKDPQPPAGALAEAIREAFGSFEAAKAQFVAAATEVEGSGWAVLAHEPRADRLVVLQVEKYQDQVLPGVTPLLACDVWEHAYYLQYHNRRADWVSAFVKQLADWTFADKMLAASRGGK